MLRRFRSVLICSIFLAPALAHAHGLGVECRVQGERVEVKAFFSDRTRAEGARITLKDAEGQTIAAETTNVRGYAYIPRPRPGRYTLVVDAGAGHRLEEPLTVPELDAAAAGQGVLISQGLTEEEFASFPWIKTAIGIATICVICAAGWLYARQRHRKQGTAEHESPATP